MKIGFKIVNDIRKKELTVLMLDLFANDRQLTTEVGFYFEKNEMNEIFREYFLQAKGRLNHHCSYNNTVLFFEKINDNILHEVQLAKTLSSDYSIIHLTPSREFDSQYSEKNLIKEAIPLLSKLNDLAINQNYAFYLENIYHNMEFYSELFSRIKENGLDRIHFCFDLGHAKACSSNNIGEWYHFLKELYSWGFNIHFHLHMNNGFEDDHLSLIEYTYPQGDWFSGGILYDHLIKELIVNFPKSRKIFEVKPEYAISNMAYVKRMLREGAGQNLNASISCNKIFKNSSLKV